MWSWSTSVFAMGVGQLANSFWYRRTHISWSARRYAIGHLRYISFNAATLVAAYGGDGVGLRPLCTVLDLLGRGIITVVPRDVTGGRHKAGSAAGGSSTRLGKATSRLERLPWLPASATPPTPSPREDEPKGEAPEPARPAPLPQPTMNWHAVAAASSQPKREVRRRASARRSRGERFLPTARPQK